MEYILLLIGFVLLIKGADFFVDGSSNLAKLFNVPSIIIGLTIVSLGTSLPEAAVSITASLSGSNDLALSNITGSNIFNLMVVVGVCAAIKPLAIQDALIKRDFPVTIASCILLIIFMLDKTISRVEGIIFLVACVAYILYLVFDARKSSMATAGDLAEDEKPSILKSLIFLAIGIPAIIFGGDIVVKNAIIIAENFGMSETIIGLTIVAIGTSLPELTTSLVASKKGESGIALGNALGSCILNVLFIMGATATVSPVLVANSSFIHVGIMLLTTLLMYVFAFTGKTINRTEGFICVMIYIAYMVYLILI